MGRLTEMANGADLAGPRARGAVAGQEGGVEEGSS